MIINGYQLVRDPVTVTESRTPQYTEMQVPFGDKIIFDENSVDGSYSFNLILVNDEIEDIKGMIEGYRIIHINFDKFYGFMYVTKFETEWIKMLSNVRYASVSLEGYYSSNMYLKLGHFSSSQKTDFTTEIIEYISLPDEFVNKVSETADFVVPDNTRTDDISYFQDITGDLYFRPDPEIFKDGCIRVYNDPTTTTTNNQVFNDTNEDCVLTVDTGLYKYKFLNNCATLVANVYDPSGTRVTYIADSIDNCLGVDKKLKYNPFCTEVKANHTTYRFKPNREYYELIGNTTHVYFQSRDIYISCKPTCDVGSYELTTASPTTIMQDIRIAAGTPSYSIDYLYSPGYVGYREGKTSQYKFTTETRRHPKQGFYADSERIFHGLTEYDPIVIEWDDWDSSTGYTHGTNGATYNGLANYMETSTNGSYCSKALTLDEGSYDIFAMLRTNTHTFSLTIDSTVEYTAPPFSNTMANNVYLGNYDLDGTHTFKITDISGTSGLNFHIYEMIIMPTNLGTGTPWEQICSAFLDTYEAYEMY